MSDPWVSVQCLMADPIPGLVILGSIKKQTEKNQGMQTSQQLFSVSSLSAPAPSFYPVLTSFNDEKQMET